MMRRRVVCLLLAVLAGGASAREAQACHRFSVWKYPYPQRCSVRAQPRAEAPVWYVEFVLPPNLNWEGAPLWQALANRIEPPQ